MKVKFLTIMAAATMVLAACGNDDESDNWAGEIRLSSGLDVQQVTRAGTSIQSSQFADGEKIDVFISENTMQGQAEGTVTRYAQPLVYTAGGDGTMTPATQPYFPASGNGVNIHAYYPSGKVSDITATSLLFSVAEDQSGDSNYKASDLMYGNPVVNPIARTSSPTTLTFKHLLSKVTVTLTPGEGTPNLTDAIVKLKSVKPSTTLNPSTGEISVACGTPTDIIVKANTNSASSGSAVVVPQTLETSFIEVELANGGKLTSKDLKDGSDKTINSVVLTAGKEFKYNITVNLTSLDVTSTITPWTPTTAATGSAEMP